MFVIMVYDIAEERVVKVLKVARRYLNWVQNSVFEGELTHAQLERLRAELNEIIDPLRDSIIFYKFRTKSYFEREVVGLEKASPQNPII